MFFIAVILFSLTSFNCYSQQIKGIVIDENTGEKLVYVHIGVEDRNVGTISDDQGEFQIELEKIDNNEKILFSSIGYETKVLIKSSIEKDKLVIKLKPTIYELEEVIVTTTKNKSENKRIKLGRYKLTKTTTGQSGIDKFGFGGEWGIQIKYTGIKYYLEEVNFHTKFNTVDSVLYRINVYNAEGGLPTKLNMTQFVKSYKKDKWIKANFLSHDLLIEDDIIVTFELVRIWYSKKGDNYLFYTHGKNYKEGMSYSKNSSFDKWKVNERPPIAMYITGIVQDE
jgi:hypothetical protein